MTRRFESFFAQYTPRSLHDLHDLRDCLDRHGTLVCATSLRASVAETATAVASLSASERTRHASYQNAIVARRFALSRQILRALLGEALGRVPAEVGVVTGPTGKPMLADGDHAPLWFSLSHCGDLLVLVLSRQGEVGVDVELIRPVGAWRKIAQRIFSPEEHDAMTAGLEEGLDAARVFLAHWCRLEAALKATGCGIEGMDTHRQQTREGGLTIVDIPDVELPSDLAADPVRYLGAIAFWDGRLSLASSPNAASVHSTPIARPASASTP